MSKSKGPVLHVHVAQSVACQWKVHFSKRFSLSLSEKWRRDTGLVTVNVGKIGVTSVGDQVVSLDQV